MMQQVEANSMPSGRSLRHPMMKTPFEQAIEELTQTAIESSIQTRKALTPQEEYAAWMDPLSRDEVRFLALIHGTRGD